MRVLADRLEYAAAPRVDDVAAIGHGPGGR
jgi:hypothetical protein